MCYQCFDNCLKMPLEIEGFLVSILTLVLAWKIYKNFDVKKQYLNKQLNVVTELSSELSKAKVCVSFYLKIPDSVQTPQKQVLTQFDDLDFFSLTNEFNPGYKRVLIKARSIHQIFPFIDYSLNPILPSSIAIKLKSLNKYLEYSSAVNADAISDSYVVLSQATKYIISTAYKNSEVVLPEFTYEYKNIQELKEEIIALRREIVEWLKKYGAEDINF